MKQLHNYLMKCVLAFTAASWLGFSPIHAEEADAGRMTSGEAGAVAERSEGSGATIEPAKAAPTESPQEGTEPTPAGGSGSIQILNLKVPVRIFAGGAEDEPVRVNPDDPPLALAPGRYRLVNAGTDQEWEPVEITPGRKLVLDAARVVGWLSAKNITAPVKIIDQTSGQRIDLITPGHDPIQLLAGSYKLAGSRIDQEWGVIDLAPGESRVIDANEYVGWLAVTHSTMPVKIIDQKTGRKVDHFQPNDKPVQVTSGSYKVINTGTNQVWGSIELSPGETREVDARAYVGWLSLPKLKTAVGIYSKASGKRVAKVKPADPPLQLLAGSYKLRRAGGPKQADVVEIPPGRDVVVDLE